MCRSGLRHCRATRSRAQLDLENAQARVSRNRARGRSAASLEDAAGVEKYANLQREAEQDVTRLTLAVASHSESPTDPEQVPGADAPSPEPDPANGAWETVKDTRAGLEARYPGVKFSLMQRSGHVVVSKVSTVKEQRGQGLAGKAMRDLIAQADEKGWTLALTPANDFGASKTRLQAWYRSLGFVPNKGRNRDFEISEDMIRTPGGKK